MELKKEEVVYKSGKLSLTEKIFDVDGEELKRVSLSLGTDAVLIIPKSADGKVHLVKQKRGDRNVVEFPSGGIEKGEDILKAGRRELSEELGLEGFLTHIGEFRPFASLVDLKVNVVLAENIKRQSEDERLSPESYEDIEEMVVDFDQIDELINDGMVSNSYFLSAYAILSAFLNKGIA